MLNTLRQNAGSWIIKFLLLAIVVVFIFWGVGSFNSTREGRVALVNGQTISAEEYNKAYFMAVENLKYQMGGQLDNSLIEMLNVKEQVLTELINNKLLTEEAERLKFNVTNEDLVASIRNIPIFQNNGTFDNNRYRMVLNSMRRSPEEFEMLQKEALLIGKLRTFISGTVHVSELEALEWFQFQNASINIDYKLFEPSSYTNIHPAEEEVWTYFDDHRDNYKTEPMVKVQYFRFSPDQYKDKIVISDEKIQNDYEENKDSFFEPATVEARHILFRTPPAAGPESIEEKRLLAEKIMKEAKAGTDFAELAKQYSEDPAKANGGFLGAFKKEEMIQPFSDAAFSMKAGEISQPVQTQFGWHIIKVEKINPEKQRTLDEVREEIRKKLADKEAEQTAYSTAEAVYDASYDTNDLKAIAESKSIPLNTTEFFGMAGPKGDISQPAKFAEVAAKLEKDEISAIENIGSDFFIIQTIDKKEAAIPEFAEVKEKVQKDLVNDLQNKQAEKDAELLLSRLSGKKESENAGTDPAFTATGFFKRTETIPSIGSEKSIAEAAFALTAENPLPKAVLKGEKGYYVIRFKERKIPDKEAFLLEKEQVSKNLLGKKQEETFTALVDRLREKADISIKAGSI